MTSENIINDSRANIHEKLDALIACYEEVIKMSAANDMNALNYWARQGLSNLRGFRRECSKMTDLLEKLFHAYDEKLFRLCLKEDGEGFVRPDYLPPTVLI